MSDKINPDAAMSMAEIMRQFGHPSAKNLGHYTDAVVKALKDVVLYHHGNCPRARSVIDISAGLPVDNRAPCNCGVGLWIEAVRQLLPEEKEPHINSDIVTGD